MRVLLIEDDTAAAGTIELVLRSDNFEVKCASVGQEGIELAGTEHFDLMLLDLNLPDISGYEILQQLRTANVNTPIMILSGYSAVDDKVRGFAFGADDYITKPFHKDELLARIHAVIRRSRPQDDNVITVDDLAINLDTKAVEIAGKRVHLTAKEYEILELLALRRGTTLTKEMFLNKLYGGMDEPEIKIIDVFVCKLRRKLSNASGGKSYVATTWGRGYRLAEPEEIAGGLAMTA